MRLAFDIETDGLIPELTTIHCLCIKDLDEPEEGVSTWTGDDLATGLKMLMDAPYLTGHNILLYDIPAIQKLYPWFKPKGVIRDTLVMCKMVWPTDKLKELDFPRWRKGTLPGQLIGAQGLEAWGYRMGLMKGEYSKSVKEMSKELQAHNDVSKIPEWAKVLIETGPNGGLILNPWKAWNQPMQDYCVQDVEVTHKLFDLIMGHFDGTGKAAQGIGWSERSIELEHRVWLHVDQQEKHGYGFDRDEAVKFAAELKTRQGQLEDKLVEAFGSWWQALDDKEAGHRPARAYNEKATWLPDVTIERYGKTGKKLAPYVGPPLIGYSPDAPFVRIQWTTFNPKSRQQLGDRLQEVYGWTPTEFGGKNNDQAKVDETTIRNIDPRVLSDELRETILEFLVISKTLGQLADGKKAWIALCTEDGRIHGRMDPLGTVSHRGAHKDPNLGQVPSVTKEKNADGVEVPVFGWRGGFGMECRGLFKPGRPFKHQTGVDCSGLELRLLGHYLHPYDEGVFADRVSTPGLDIHAENAKITGLSRADTKTVTYAFLYGAGSLKIGLGVGVPEDQIEAIANSPAAKQYVGWLRRAMKHRFIMPDPFTLAHTIRGSEVKKAFMEGITGLKDLQRELQEEAKQYGFIVALDGRKLSIRKAHAVLNQALQGGGAIVCKEWMLETDRLLREHYALTYNRDYAQMAWVHDELQFEHMDEAHGPIIIEASQKAVENVAASLNFRGRLATDGKSGLNWRDCH